MVKNSADFTVVLKGKLKAKIAKADVKEANSFFICPP
jgi:hypothetical protein